MEKVLSFCRYDLSNEACMKNLKDNPGLAFLGVDIFNDLFLFHQVHVLGPNLVHSEEKVLALTEFGNPASCFRLHIESLFHPVEVNVPKWTQLKNANSIDSIHALTTSDNTSSKLRSKNIMIVPPLVLSTIVNAGTLDPEPLMLLLTDAFKEYDRTSETVKACTVLRPVIEFLWAASKNLLPHVAFSIDRSDTGTKWNTALHLSNLKTIPLVTEDPLLVSSQSQGQTDLWMNISDSLKKISDSSSKVSLNDSNGEDGHKNNSNGWDKIPHMIQHMILRLSSATDESFPIIPVATYLQVLKQNKALGVSMILNVMLSTMGCQVEITTSMASTIKTGNFRANSLQVAHPFSIFNVPYADAAHLSCFNQTELDLFQSEGDGIPKDVVKKLSENKFKSPTNTHLLRHQFNNWYGVLQICFGPKALITLETKEWINHIDKHETSYDASFKNDKDFGAKVLGLVDLTFYQLCDSCLRATQPEDVDFSLISLNTKRFDILQNCFQANKPSYLVTFKPPPASIDDDDKFQDGEGKKKKAKVDKDKDYQPKDLGNIIKNPNTVKEWIVTKNYKLIFNKGINRNTPPFNDAGLITCNKWHIQGYCFEKCDRKATHKNFPNDSLKQAYGKWVKEVKDKSPHKSS